MARNISRSARLLLTAAVVVLVPLLTAAECSGSQVGRVAQEGKSLAERYAEEGHSIRIREAPEAPVVVRSFDTAASGEEVDRLAASSPLADLDAEDVVAVAQAACKAKDLYDLYEADTPEDAADQLLSMGSGPVAYRAKVRQLASDLSDSESTGDTASIAGVAAFCEAADAGGE